jgi:hypothetical protein
MFGAIEAAATVGIVTSTVVSIMTAEAAEFRHRGLQKKYNCRNAHRRSLAGPFRSGHDRLLRDEGRRLACDCRFTNPRARKHSAHSTRDSIPQSKALCEFRYGA